jgi:hypothetical protein
MEKVVALVLLAYAIGLPVPAFWVLVREALQDRMYGREELQHSSYDLAEHCLPNSISRG